MINYIWRFNDCTVYEVDDEQYTTVVFNVVAKRDGVEVHQTVVPQFTKDVDAAARDWTMGTRRSRTDGQTDSGTPSVSRTWRSSTYPRTMSSTRGRSWTSTNTSQG